MTRKNASKNLHAESKRATSAKPRKGRPTFGESLIAAAEEILAYKRGEITLESREIPAPVDVKAIRTATGLSQAQFAGRFGFNTRTLQEWEVGRSTPPSPVRAYLMVIERDREAVERALGQR